MSGSTLEDEATIETMKSKNANITLHPLIRKVGKLFVEIQDGATRAVGIIKNDVFNKIYELKDLASEGYLDQTKSVYIIPNGSTDTLIFLETREVVVVPHIDTILLARKENTSLILTTKRGSMERVHTEFRGNPRYTDWIDLDTRYRLGYIDASDSTKLSLQNYPPNTGILILLDRSTGVSSILRTPFDMMGFMRLGDGIGFIDKTGQKFTIENIIPGF